MATIAIYTFLLLHISIGCDYFYPAIDLTPQYLVDNITVGEIIEISFELQLNDTCDSGWCHILRITDDAKQVRLPMINIPSSSHGIRAVYSDSTGISTGYDIDDAHLISTFNDANYHHYYFKWSKTERIFIYDDIVYENITDGSYDSSNYIDKQYGLWIIDTNNPLDGNIIDLCINSSWYSDTDPNECTFYHKNPIKIIKNNQIGSITIDNTIEVSFDLQLIPSWNCSNGWCNILRIGSVTSSSPRFPLLAFIPPIGIHFSVSGNSGQRADNIENLSIINDGNYHRLYFKMSYTKRLFIFDYNFIYNFAGELFDEKIGNNYAILVCGENSNPLVNGLVKNLCINTYKQTNNPTINPTVPTVYPSIKPTYKPNYMNRSPTPCSGICDLYNVTLTAINQTIINCKKAPNCECKKGIKTLKMKYLGKSIASEIIFYYWNKANTEICKYSNIKTNDIITCNAQNIKYSQFFSETHFIIKFNNNIECNGYIDTSCTYNIIGTLSKQCQYLQVIEYTDYFDDICYDNIIPKLIPYSHSDTQQKRYNYWKTKTMHSDSSGRHSRRLLWDYYHHHHDHYHHYYSSSSSWSSSWSSSSSSSNMRWNPLIAQIKHMNCYNGIVSEDDSYDGYNSQYYPIQTMVCMKYSIKNLISVYKKTCGYLDSVLLPLCKNDISNMNVYDLDNLIVSVMPNTLTVKSVNDDGILGVLVEFNGDTSNEFQLCLRNVSVSMGVYDRYGKMQVNRLKITDYGTLEMTEREAVCQNSHGLPCLNFAFDGDGFMESSEDIIDAKNCDCNNDLISLDFKYEGEEIAEMVRVRYNKGSFVLCEFTNVSPGDILTCTPSNSKTKYANHFGYKTFIDIKTQNENECTGKLWTSCIKHHILGSMDNGCNVIRIIGWIDELNKICDNTVNKYNYYLTNYNALVYTNEEIDTETDAIHVFDKMDVSLKAVIVFIGVGICCGLFWVASIFCFGVFVQLFYQNREYNQQLQNESGLFDPNANVINIKLKKPKQIQSKQIQQTVNDTLKLNDKYYDEKEEEDENDDNTYFFNDNPVSKDMGNDMKY
eukprot:347242_1